MRMQLYHFVSHWLIPGPPSTIEKLLFTTETSQWWPGLESITALDTDQPEPRRYRCVWRSQSGYRLTTIITITAHKPGELVQFESEGDLKGSGSFRFEASTDECTKITINWDVATTKAWMTYGAFIFKPLFIKNHHRLMEDGEQGLIAYVNRNNTSATGV